MQAKERVSALMIGLDLQSHHACIAIHACRDFDNWRRLLSNQEGCPLHFNNLTIIIVFVFIIYLNNSRIILSLRSFVAFQQIDEPLYVDQNLAIASLVRINFDWGKICLLCLLLQMEGANHFVNTVVSEVVAAPACSA